VLRAGCQEDPLFFDVSAIASWGRDKHDLLLHVQHIQGAR
jgi:hypothetical protein